MTATFGSIQLIEYTDAGIINIRNHNPLTSEDTDAELAEQTIVSSEPVTGWGEYDTLIQTVDAHDEVRWYLAV